MTSFTYSWTAWFKIKNGFDGNLFRSWQGNGGNYLTSQQRMLLRLTDTGTKFRWRTNGTNGIDYTFETERNIDEWFFVGFTITKMDFTTTMKKDMHIYINNEMFQTMDDTITCAAADSNYKWGEELGTSNMMSLRWHHWGHTIHHFKIRMIDECNEFTFGGSKPPICGCGAQEYWDATSKSCKGMVIEEYHKGVTPSATGATQLEQPGVSSVTI